MAFQQILLVYKSITLQYENELVKFISNESFYFKSEKLYCIPTIGVSISLYMYFKKTLL